MLRAVNGRLDAARARAAAYLAGNVLLTVMSKTNEHYNFIKLARELHRLEAPLDPAMARKIFETLLALLDTPYGFSSLEEITLALLEWSARLDEAMTVAAAQKSARMLLTALSRAQGQQVDSSTFVRALQAVCHRLSSRELALLLEHPLAAGLAQRVLLEALGDRSRRDFRNPWHFLEWTQSNGVALVPSSPAGDAR
jgi:hypothetical protein